MSFMLIRSIPLGRRTMQAWREAGGVFAPRGQTDYERSLMAEGFEFVINLGKTNANFYDYTVPVYNEGVHIAPLVTPGGTRRVMPDLLPPQNPGKVWVKAPGRAGRGKFLVETTSNLILPEGWDWQEHIDGQEYRIITVGHRVVQDFLRYGENGRREYVWTPMRSVPSQVKEIARTAARTVRGSNVIAWDVISSAAGGSAYILEGNTSPGMSTPTAERIVRAIREDLE